MRYHIIVKIRTNEDKKQFKEVNGFIQRSKLESEIGNTIIICERKQNGDDKQELAEMAPTKSVIFIMAEDYEPETVLDFLENIIDVRDLYLFGSNDSAHELTVRLGKRLGGSSLTGCLRLEEKKEEVFAEKMVYSNHMKGTFKLRQSPCCITVAKGQEEAESQYKDSHEILEYELKNTDKSKLFSEKVWKETESKAGLEEASFIIAAGRGLKKKEAVQELEKLSQRMHAAFGASRPVVMNAWTSMQKLIGVSGSICKPDICIAAGVSGAPAFYAGIEKSKLIIAVNTDEKAPVIKKSDVAIIGDYKEVLEEIAKRMEEEDSDG